jgi:predicted RNase H-like HicB family nuclease
MGAEGISALAGASAMKLSEYLRIPYLLQASSVQSQDGRWVRRAEFPELPHCVAESSSIVDAIAAVEELRVEILADMVRKNELPPTPRQPLQSIDGEEELRRYGFTESGQRQNG